MGTGPEHQSASEDPGAARASLTGQQVVFVWLALLALVFVARLLAPTGDLADFAREPSVDETTGQPEGGAPVGRADARSPQLLSPGVSPGVVRPQIGTIDPAGQAALLASGSGSGSGWGTSTGTPQPLFGAGTAGGAGATPAPGAAPRPAEARVDLVPPPEGGGPSPYDPAWATVPALRTIVLLHDGNLSNDENGDRLQDAVAALQPGDTLKLGPGSWKLDAPLRFTMSGSAAAPLRLEALNTDKPLVKRGDILDGLIEIGGEGAAPAVSHVAVRGLHLKGGDAAVRVHKATQIWIDCCRMRDTGGGVHATTEHSDHLFITRNEIHDTQSWGEGVALGKSVPNRRCTSSIVALNHIHHTTEALQGDGIDIKWQSYGNWIVENVIHHTRYPSIIFLGTGGNPRNVIERNLCHDSQDNLIQAEAGEAIVRNNLLIAPSGNKLFDSTHNAADLRDLEVVHNTMVGSNGRGAGLYAWDGQPGLVFANNAIYVEDDFAEAYSIALTPGAAGGLISGNVVHGKTADLTWGFVNGSGLGDFEGVPNWNWVYDEAAGADWTALRPTPGGALDASADPVFVADEDYAGEARTLPSEAGALMRD